jgi:hypothetical protein
MEKPLTSCPTCTSCLIYPTGFDRDDETGGMIIERRCPECEHVDVVCAPLRASLAWIHRERQIRRQLIRRVIDLELEDILGVTETAEL